MAVDVYAGYADQAFNELLWKLDILGDIEDTRGGRVKTIPMPTVLTLTNPRNRIVYNPIRNANPIFHVMEFVWMMAGEKNVEWIAQFNKRMVEYADPDGNISGAYGARWQRQIPEIVRKFQDDRNTRQAVISMWDPIIDNQRGHRDYPCNTHIYFRNQQGRLDMTVCNRSNDLVWGMLGANIVHMTLLHEFIARACGFDLGYYQVFTNNLHIYEHHWHFLNKANHYAPGILLPSDQCPVLLSQEDWRVFMAECQTFVHNGGTPPGFINGFGSSWLNEVARPIYEGYMRRLHRMGDGMDCFSRIEAPDWRLAVTEWIARKDLASPAG